MAVAWGGVFLCGAIIARYVPKSRVSWFPAHWILQLIGVCMTIAALVLTIVYLSQIGMSHFSTYSVSRGAHQIVGIICIAFMAASFGLGIGSHVVYDKDRHGPPVFPDQIHWWIGRIGILLGIASVFLGIWEMQVDAFYYGIFAAIVGAILLLVVLLEIGRIKSLKTHPDDPGFHMHFLHPK